MSLLMFHLDDDGALIVTDTLATTTDGTPFSLATKCFPVPHLGLVVCGTGLAATGVQWSSFVQSSMVCRDIDMLNSHTTEGLRRIWRDLETEFGLLNMTSTIYHVGFSEDRQKCVAYAYRSENSFESEALEPGFRVKPHPHVMPADPPTTIDDFIDLARVIKREQDARAIGDRVFIGGDLVLTYLNSGTVAYQNVHRFPDFEDAWIEMNERLGREQLE